MNKEKLKSNGKSKTYILSITVRITKACSKWLSENKLSPTKIFREACKELGFRGKK
jgi:hypothetical protein